MKTITVTVDGIDKNLEFELQQDGWYFNKEYNLYISPLLNSCVTEPIKDSGYVFPLEVSGFKVNNIDNILKDIYNYASQNSKKIVSRAF